MNENVIETPKNEPYTIPEALAIELSVYASRWLQENLGISTEEFFREVNQTSLTREEVPVFTKRVVNAEMSEKFNHFWVYRAFKNILELDPENPYQYFDNREDALKQHEENIGNNYDSYTRGASGASMNSSEVSRGLFELYLAYGLMVITHEPFHPWVSNLLNENKLNDDYYVNEALTSYLGIQALALIANEIKATHPKISQGIEMFIKVNEISLRFYHCAYFILKRSYEKNKEIEGRDEDSNQLLEEIDWYSRRLNTRDDTEEVNRINRTNNARISASVNYSGFLWVKKYFTENGLNFKEFIQNPADHIEKLFEFVESRMNQAPDNLEKEWDEIKELISSGAANISLDK